MVLRQDAARSYSDMAAADLSGDGIADLLISDASGPNLYFFQGRENRQLGAPALLRLSDASLQVGLADLKGDGFIDATRTSSAGQSASVILNRGAGSFNSAVNYSLGFTPVGHRMADLDNDGALDLIAFSASEAMILPGRSLGASSNRFVRGDVDGDGQIDILDAIQLLLVLFRGHPTDCKDALDTNDDGRLDTTDGIRLLEYLFKAGPPPPSPFPQAELDPTQDTLDCRRTYEF